MLMPKRVKYRKQMRGRMKGKALRGSTVSFGESVATGVGHGVSPLGILWGSWGDLVGFMGAPGSEVGAGSEFRLGGWGWRRG